MAVTWPSIPASGDTDTGSPLEEDLFDPIREALEYQAVARKITIDIPIWEQSPSSDDISEVTLASTFKVTSFGPTGTPGILTWPFAIPQGYDEDSDLVFHVLAAMSSSEASKNIKLDARVWLFADDLGVGGGTPTDVTETFVPDNDTDYNKWVGSSSNLVIPDGTTRLAPGNVGVVRLERDNSVGSNHGGSLYLFKLWLTCNE